MLPVSPRTRHISSVLLSRFTRLAAASRDGDVRMDLFLIAHEVAGTARRTGTFEHQPNRPAHAIADQIATASRDPFFPPDPSRQLHSCTPLPSMIVTWFHAAGTMSMCPVAVTIA